MRRINALIVAIGLFASLGTLPCASQTRTPLERKVIERVAPVYPQLAKRLNVKGVVKMEIVVRADGSVKSTKVIGGNPVLLESANDAVRKWKFETAAEETTEVVQLSFFP
ncbi:MAG: energy transducer TonB [Candidatus Sulfotelmatobacter sp.]